MPVDKRAVTHCSASRTSPALGYADPGWRKLCQPFLPLMLPKCLCTSAVDHPEAIECGPAFIDIPLDCRAGGLSKHIVLSVQQRTTLFLHLHLEVTGADVQQMRGHGCLKQPFRFFRHGEFPPNDCWKITCLQALPGMNPRASAQELGDQNCAASFTLPQRPGDKSSPPCWLSLVTLRTCSVKPAPKSQQSGVNLLSTI